MSTPQELADAVATVVMGAERNGPCTADELTSTEQRLGVRLPPDVRAFYERMNGTPDMTDAAHGLITFWTLDKWKWIEDEAPEYAQGPLANTVVFADHSYWCWAYSARFTADERLEVYLVANGAPIPIATTFTDFVQMVLTDDQALYGKAG